MNAISKPKVKLYSYARFSSASQGEGTSIVRQLSLADEFVIKHPEFNFELINEYQDDGVYSFRNRNITVGRLGQFLKDLKL
jgi:hypothetical protein